LKACKKTQKGYDEKWSFHGMKVEKLKRELRENGDQYSKHLEINGT
jgi:hypothetical protein